MTQPSELPRLRDALLQITQRSTRPVVGLTLAEIQALEHAFGVALPDPYVQFLLVAGRDTGSFMFGSDMNASSMVRIRQNALGLLAEAGLPALRVADFVFCSHQGYQFLYFCADGVDSDPPVFYFMEGTSGPTKVYDSFSEWLQRTVQEEFGS